ncbi:MAG: lipoate--protein ligase family protein [Anaerolineae bacterium]|nr:lipoate--protein ligase family protein [Anaerolineae bacterium]
MSDYPYATWRLLRSAPAGGATNMAVDEAILCAVAAGLAPPMLRLYAWEPACLSLGRAQPLADVDMEALQAAGFDLVRRPTGGKSILHVDELTYSVVAPQTEPRVAGGIVESYRRLSAGLVRGLERLGVTGLVADRRAPPPRFGGAGGGKGPVCFETPSDYEITAGGRKLVGSAQMRARGVVLQHGALPLYGDITRICPLLTAHPDPARVRTRATTVEEVLGRPITWDEAADALAAGFAEALNLRLEPGTLTDEERAWAQELRAERYATKEWTGRV